MGYTIDIIDRKGEEKAIIYREDGKISDVIGKYWPSEGKKGINYIHFADNFETFIGDVSCGVVNPVFIPFDGMTLTLGRHIKFRGEGLEFVVDLIENKVISVQVQ